MSILGGLDKRVLRVLCLGVLLLGLSTGLASADWLVTLEGQLIETDGPWTVGEQAVIYRGLDGTEKRLMRSKVDLEASASTTALRTGKPYVAPVIPTSAKEAAVEDAEVSDEVILYATVWCGYCRKARKLLKELDVDYEEKDIEKSREAAREMVEKVGGRSGVPVLDIGGKIIRGYNERMIRRAIDELRQRAEA